MLYYIISPKLTSALEDSNVSIIRVEERSC